MTTIVAFRVPTRKHGEEALDRLEGIAEDAAVVYTTRRGKVRVQHSIDIAAPSAALHRGLLDATVGIFTTPPGDTEQGGAPGAIYGELRTRGLGDVMRLASEQVRAGHVAVFVLAGDDVAHAIENALRDSGLDVLVGTFSAEAQQIVRDTLTMQSTAEENR